MNVMTVQGRRIYYDRLGSGEPLLLIHGLGERKEGWVHQHELADTYELIIPDLRGHGKCKNHDGISIENFAGDMLDLLDQLGIRSAHICGLSMGGVIAQELYRQAPERCRSLILVNTYFFVPYVFRQMIYNLYMWRLNILPSAIRMQWAVWLCLFAQDEEIVKRFQHAIIPEFKAYKKSVAACLKVDNRLLLPQIRVPTLLIGSDFDMLTPAWNQIMMHQFIPDSKLLIFRNTGHMAKLERPEEFNRILREFLDEKTCAFHHKS